jgi:hypothetical protein
LSDIRDLREKAPVQWKAKSIARGKHLTGRAELQALPGRTPPRREGDEKEFFCKRGPTYELPLTANSFFDKKFKPIGACSAHSIVSLFLPGHFIPAPFFNVFSSLPGT